MPHEEAYMVTLRSTRQPYFYHPICATELSSAHIPFVAGLLGAVGVRGSKSSACWMYEDFAVGKRQIEKLSIVIVIPGWCPGYKRWRYSDGQ